ncbi:hypothetical protein TNCV_382761 [Trichonephila clavipes]|nr:hypothetical protein TNCV_382761 [Trichonephila clavipes]
MELMHVITFRKNESGSCSVPPPPRRNLLYPSSSVVISVGVAFRDLCGTFFISIFGFGIFERFLLFLDFRFTICWLQLYVECSLLDSLGTDSGKFSVETELNCSSEWHHLELQDRRDYTPADRAARTCWLGCPAPVLSGGLRRKTQLFSCTLYMAASSKTPPH